jgi:hypothetical protein
MKKTLLVIAGLVATVSTMAQGSANFHTRILTTPSVNAPVKETPANGGAAVAAGAYWAGLYWGTSADSLQPAFEIKGGAPVYLAADFAGATGYVTKGKTLINGAAEGATIFVQMRAWSKTANGQANATYAAAYANIGSKVGSSNIIRFTLGGDNLVPPAVPAVMEGLQSFTVDVVPEPSILALGVLGGVAFLLRRRS